MRRYVYGVAFAGVLAIGGSFSFIAASCSDFCDISKKVGISSEVRYGKSVAFADINSDGWDDFWIADADTRFGKSYGFSQMYLNEAGKRFKQIDPHDLGIADEDLVINWSASFADFDNDGDPDLMLSDGGWESGTLAFYRNDISDSGKFVEITKESGLSTEWQEWWGSTWADYDNDGYLDVLIVVRVGRPLLYHNNGDGTFTEVSRAMGIDAVLENGKNPLWFDYDLDGDQDLFIAGFGESDVRLYRNDGNRFTLVNSALILKTTLSDKAPLGLVFSAVSEDFNLDGFPDLYWGRDIHQDILFINQGDGTFFGYGREIGLDMNVGEGGGENSMSVGVGDINNSGYPDILIGTGHEQRYDDIIYCIKKDENAEAGVSVSRCSDPVVKGHGKQITHGIVLNDFDLDGDADILYNLGGSAWYDERVQRESTSGEVPDSRGRTILYQRTKDPSIHTALIKLQGTVSNRDAVGARIEVKGSQDQYYWVRSSQGFVSQQGSWIVVQLGSVLSADMTIIWPKGSVSTMTIHEGDKKVIIE